MTTLRQLPFATRHPVLAGLAAGAVLAVVLSVLHGLNVLGLSSSAWMVVLWSLLAWRRRLAFRLPAAFLAIVAVDVLRGLPVTSAIASAGIAVAVAGLYPHPGPTARVGGPEHLGFVVVVSLGWWMALGIVAVLLPRIQPMSAWVPLHVLALMVLVAAVCVVFTLVRGSVGAGRPVGSRLT